MSIIKIIKEKGFTGCVKAVNSKLIIEPYNRALFKKYSADSIDSNSIVLESEGDCSDNAYALFDYMKQNGYLQRYHVTWLVDCPENFHEEANVKYVRKNTHDKLSKDTIKALATCRWYVYDHCNILAHFKKRDGQSMSYLCHGYAGFKAAKGGGVFDADEEFTTGEIPYQGLVDLHGQEAPKYILGFPRLDYFADYQSKYSQIAELIVEKPKFKKVFLWMPTFRQSHNKSISEDYFTSETGLPLFDSYDSLRQMNDYLLKLDIKIVLKIHHLQSDLACFKKRFSNIQFLRDEDLRSAGLQLYQFIPVFDALITDYSSIATDYLLLDKPIIFILDDMEEYKKSRGLYPENPLIYMPGDHVYDVDQLKTAMENVIAGEDQYRTERNLLLPKFHTYRNGNASKRILDHLGIVQEGGESGELS